MKKNLLTVLVLLLIKTTCIAQSWSSIGSGLGGQVNAMTTYNGNLYAAGNFTTDGNSNPVLHVAKWNGSSWVNVGNGFNGNVNALAFFNGELYAAGAFTASGSTTLNRIAKWNGTTWADVSSGLSNFANCLFVYNGALYVGGAFTTAGGSTTVNRIAKWNGTTWSALGSGISGGNVNSIAAYNNEIYVGGTQAGLVSKFNGTTWSIAGSINGIEVKCLAAWGPNGGSSSSTTYLYAGGDINLPSAGMIRWNGTSWNSAVTPFNSTGKPKVFCPTYSYLYAGGAFDISVSGHQVKSVAKFNNSFWDSVGTGMDNDVLALTVFNGVLHAGGNFLNAEGASAKYVAKRNSLVGIDEMNGSIISKNFFPNPVIAEAILKIKTGTSLNQPELKMFDMIGKEINPLTEIISLDKFNHEIEYRIERSGLPSGIYFYQFSDEKKIIITGKFAVE